MVTIPDLPLREVQHLDDESFLNMAVSRRRLRRVEEASARLRGLLDVEDGVLYVTDGLRLGSRSAILPARSEDPPASTPSTVVSRPA